MSRPAPCSRYLLDLGLQVTCGSRAPYPLLPLGQRVVGNPDAEVS